ncbi:MAG: hypothetical protein COS76_02445 [Candidatus Portnoybacteria bacterium CG06_land_8_20_14_3_00_39_12]|uniref:Uncharacterized protein n=1 Tax=Candidatus Portnoybacteria bacterium CG06_land_8_20_14_3_00_39_12 TaxID=1974809 RepID=A0A2M7AX36_9BACT|nr:MAG: hypothetical protein AUJ33_01175 [Parcubacteria group bacterium CG1_02_40_25]PIU75129.1 MAG: hypothetical protein COS76_02445 [Candidatus Portnoybacteria bacterium CG06_land_8_20_14_3_00_39_12]
MELWDYKIDKTPEMTPEVERWFLERRLNYGHFKKIKLTIIKKYWQQLKIDPAMRQMLANFIKKYA